MPNQGVDDIRMRVSIILCLAVLVSDHVATAFSPITIGASRIGKSSLVRSPTAVRATTFEPIFDFRSNETKAVESFERIDDAIMGGISTSALRDVPGEPYASWSGVCRLDGGGFCGCRTLPFEEPLQVGDADGFYLDCRLSSDDEPERRVWKMTTRTESSRGEQVYQASFKLSKNGSADTPSDDSSFVRVQIPFSDFRLVRGPRLVVDAPPISVSEGIYQIGVSLSKFVMAQNVTELENFRPGYFELQLQSIGAYYSDKRGGPGDLAAPGTVSLSDSQKKRPLLVKLLLPVAKLVFSEKSRRRRSAMRILTEERKYNRLKAIWYGIQLRARNRKLGFMRSFAQAATIVAADCLRTIVFKSLRFGVVYPLVLVRRALSFPGKLLNTRKTKS